MSSSLVKEQPKAHDDGIWAVAWTPKTNLIVTGGVDEKVKVWDSDLKLKSTLGDHSLAVTSVSPNRNGKFIASSSMDGLINVFDITSGQKSFSITAGTVETWTVAYSPTEDVLATGSHSGNVNLWSIKDGKKVGSYKTGGNFTLGVAFAPSGALIAGSTHDGVVTVFNRDGSVLHKLSGHEAPVRDIAFSPDSSKIITASNDRHLRCYEMKGGQQIASLSGHRSWILSVAYSPDGQMCASSSSDKKIKLWDLKSKEVVTTIDAHSDQVWSVDFNENGKCLASASDDMSLKTHNLIAKG